VTDLGAALLGVIQGLTEFLPVSSSAHLILARAFFGWDPGSLALGLAFDVALHLGTLVAVVVYFRQDLTAMARAVPEMWQPNPRSDARLLRLIVIGTLPIVPAGLLYTEAVEAALRTPAVAAAMLALGAIALLVAERVRTARTGADALGWPAALTIGMAQAMALVPGVSRSGATIAAGMFLGMRRDAAARFGFLLGVPAIAAAAAKEGLALVGSGLSGSTWLIFGIGTSVSAAVGYLTVKYFIRFLVGHRLDGFAYYRLALTLATVIWFMAR
jgi:undecaprenyl-diphosphatase